MTASRPRVQGPELVLAALGFTALFLAFFADTMVDRVLGFGDGPGYFRPFYDRPRTLWTDSLFAGYPVSGDAQSGFFNPLAVLLKAAGFGFDAFVVSGYVLCGVGGYGFGKALTGSRLAGVMAGLVVSLSAFVVGQFDHTAVVHTAGWTVCALAAAELCIGSGSWRAFMALAVSLALMVLAGSFQFTTSGAVLIAARLVLAVASHHDRQRLVRQLSFALVSAALLASVALSPSFELLGMSMRAALTWENFISNSYQPALLPSFLFPAFFIGKEALAGLPDVEASGFVGVLVLIFAGAGALAGPRRAVLFWCGVVLVSLVLALGPTTPLARLVFHVPGLNLFRGPSRHLFECTLGLAALAAHGVASVQAGQLTPRHRRLLGVGAATLLLVAFGLLRWVTPGAVSVPPQWSMSDGRLLVPAVVLSGGVFALHLGLTRSAPWTAGLLVLTATIEVLFVHRLAPWRAATPLEPTTVVPAPIQLVRDASRPGERIVVLRGYWDPDVPANAALVYGLASASGYSPLEPRTFAAATGIDPNGVAVDMVRLVSDGSAVLDVLAVGLVVAPPDALNATRFERVAQLPNGAVYRNLRVRPRAWFVGDTLELDHETTERAIFEGVLPDGRAFDPAAMAIVERLGARRFTAGCEANVTAKGEGLLTVETGCAGDGFLVVSERGFPGWRAEIDGRPTPLRRADLLVTGLEVPAGRHVVELTYAPSSVWLGVGGAVLGLALLLFGFLNRRRWFDEPQLA